MINSKIAIFQKKEIRKTIYENEWWFVIADVIFVLTDSKNPKGYIKDMRRRDEELSKGWGQIATPLSIDTTGGVQKLNCANTEGIFRIIQSIPSPKAEPFKRWLAKVGYERATTEITQTRDTEGFTNLKSDASEGGKIAGDAKIALENKTGKSVTTKNNYLQTPERQKKIKQSKIE